MRNMFFFDTFYCCFTMRLGSRFYMIPTKFDSRVYCGNIIYARFQFYSPLLYGAASEIMIGNNRKCDTLRTQYKASKFKL